jgi:hypothetical protein
MRVLVSRRLWAEAVCHRHFSLIASSAHALLCIERQRPLHICLLHFERAGRQHCHTLYELSVVQERECVDHLVGFGGICACCVGNQDIADGHADHIFGASTLTNDIASWGRRSEPCAPRKDISSLVLKPDQWKMLSGARNRQSLASVGVAWQRQLLALVGRNVPVPCSALALEILHNRALHPPRCR